MKTSRSCPKCKSSGVIPDAKVIDRGDGNGEYRMTIATYGKPEAWIFKDKHSSTVSAWVCVGCGFIELYADNPEKLVLDPPPAGE